MVYLTICIWFTVIILLARCVLGIWLGIVKPKTLNIALLPGTLAAHIGRIVALLITGAAPVESPSGQGTAKVANSDALPQPMMPLAGPIIVALVPMLLLGVLLYYTIMRIGAPVVAQIPPDKIARNLPTSLAAFWEQLRSLVTLCEGTLEAVRHAQAEPWQIYLFVYLLVCLTVRLAPLPGNLRGHIFAVIGLAVAAALASTLSPNMNRVVDQAWPLLCLTVGWLLLLLLGSLIAKAAVASAQTILKRD